MVFSVVPKRYAWPSTRLRLALIIEKRKPLPTSTVDRGGRGRGRWLLVADVTADHVLSSGDDLRFFRSQPALDGGQLVHERRDGFTVQAAVLVEEGPWPEQREGGFRRLAAHGRFLGARRLGGWRDVLSMLDGEAAWFWDVVAGHGFLSR